MENRINEKVAKKRAVKFYLSLHVNFHPNTDVTFLTNPPAVLSTDTIEVYDSSDIHDALDSIHENLTSAIEDFQQRGSRWVLEKLLALDFHLLEFHPLKATSCIPLRTCIQNRKAIIIIKNKNEKCFLYSVIELRFNLLLIADDDTNHYCFIKDFCKLAGSQHSSCNISADSACKGLQELTELKIEVDVEEQVKKW